MLATVYDNHDRQTYQPLHNQQTKRKILAAINFQFVFMYHPHALIWGYKLRKKCIQIKSKENWDTKNAFNRKPFVSFTEA